MHSLFLFLAAFLASAVEMVEALTIVLAVGVTRGWRSAMTGVAAALAGLAAIVIVVGPAITRLPIDALRVVVGSVLLIFGLQWLRKAMLRASGLKALHDEDAVFAQEVAELRQSNRHDWYAFTVAFKGVFLEGLEVAFLVVTLGGAQHATGLAAAGAGVALVLVVVAGLLAHAPLSRVPENTLKFGVGVMLTAFGIFWSAEGAGASWPAGDAAIIAIVAIVLGASLAIVGRARRRPIAPGAGALR
jgi:uncharacterized membrane protein